MLLEPAATTSRRLAIEKGIELPAHEVHVWCVDLTVSSSQVRPFAELLSEEERLRAAQFRFPKHREGFVVRRGILRCILAGYLGSEAQSLHFCQGRQGKPALARNREQIRFSLSHSHHIAVYAVARSREVGIDVERIDNSIRKDRIAEHFFSRTEESRLRTLPVEQQALVFFQLWTTKEAYLKAQGRGLDLSRNFEVPCFATSGDTTSFAVDGAWTGRHFMPTDGYIAAVAAQGMDWQLKRMESL
jgi:4'-phosphopantetheinyl transferase